MIRLRVREQLRMKGWTAYRLSRESGVSLPVTYRLARPRPPTRQLNLDTLDAICRALGCQPGDLLEYVPGKKAKRGKRP